MIYFLQTVLVADRSKSDNGGMETLLWIVVIAVFGIVKLLNFVLEKRKEVSEDNQEGKLILQKMRESKPAPERSDKIKYQPGDRIVAARPQRQAPAIRPQPAAIGRPAAPRRPAPRIRPKAKAVQKVAAQVTAAARRKEKEAPARPAPEAKEPEAGGLLADLTEGENLQRAIIYSEVLGKPLALRET